MTVWAADGETTIDRFDARALLEDPSAARRILEASDASQTSEPLDDLGEGVTDDALAYERYGVLVDLARRGVAEDDGIQGVEAAWLSVGKRETGDATHTNQTAHATTHHASSSFPSRTSGEATTSPTDTESARPLYQGSSLPTHRPRSRVSPA